MFGYIYGTLILYMHTCTEGRRQGEHGVEGGSMYVGVINEILFISSIYIICNVLKTLASETPYNASVRHSAGGN